MGGPFYVTDACVHFACTEDQAAEVRELIRSTLAADLEISETSKEVKTDDGWREVGWGFEVVPYSKDESRSMILFAYESEQSMEGREHEVASGINQAIPGIDAKGEFINEVW